jgi:hypothetical protein
MNNNDYRETRWYMSHLIWELATYHFDNWLKIADVYAEKKIRPKPNFDYDYNSIVFFQGEETDLKSTLLKQ